MENTEIIKQVRDVFDPVAKRLGLRGPKVSALTNIDLHFAYVGDEIGIKVELDLFNFFVFVLLFRAKGPAIPVGYEDASGKRQLWYLQDVLKQLGIDITKEEKELQRLGGDYRNCSAMAEIQARWLVEHWPAIRSQLNTWSQK